MEKITIPEQREEVLDSSITGSSAFSTSALSTNITHEPSLFYCASKRLMDIVLATLSLVGLIPLFLIIAICIKLNDGGDILYFREMIGLRGQRFFMIKFRTMVPNADAYLEEQAELMHEYQQNMKLKEDPRVTRLGKFLRRTYLDEFPQLFNILLGQMSFVGPRAIHQRELALYGVYAEKRHLVKPGLTGLWQISPNRYSCYDKRITLDMHYIDNRSFIVDLTILMKTVKVFLAQTGI